MTPLSRLQQPENQDFAGLAPGFADPVGEAQTCFRAVLDAMAHPGRVARMPAGLSGPLPLSPAAASIALTLCDIDTPVWLDAASTAAAQYITFHCGAPLAESPAEARFAFIADPTALPPLDAFALGSDEYPERSTTLVIAVSGFGGACEMRLSGPGIRSEAWLGVAGMPGRFWTERAALAELFPRGLDVLFVSGDALVALPRSTQIAA
jgi:alpha-D-ribose 1-methylphosphonate 5-triphosphate synthase subunit PhnH